MHEPESVLANEAHKILWDFEIQAERLTPARRPDLGIIYKKKKKKKKKKMDPRVKIKESEKRYKYLDLARELRKTWNIRVTVMPIAFGALGMGSEGLERELEESGNRGTN